MATPRRRFSDYCAHGPSDSLIRGKSGITRAWGHAEPVGISSTADIGHRNHPRPVTEQNELDDLDILSDLLAGPAGDDAPLLSQRLIEAFGSLVSVLAAAKLGYPSYVAIPDEVGRRLRYLSESIGSGWRLQALSAPVLANSQALSNYLQFEMALLKRETFRVLFLDSANGLLRDQLMWEGSIDRVQVHPREIVSLALELHASALILVHNHPSGRSEPSDDDIRLTDRIVSACQLLNIVVHDHLIISRNDVLSMRAAQPGVFEIQ